MNIYSIGGVELTMTRIEHEGGYRHGDPQHYVLQNCEWTAELALYESWTAGEGVSFEVSPRFCDGNQEKFHADLAHVAPVIRLELAAPGARVEIREPQY